MEQNNKHMYIDIEVIELDKHSGLPSSHWLRTNSGPVLKHRIEDYLA